MDEGEYQLRIQTWLEIKFSRLAEKAANRVIVKMGAPNSA